MPHNVPSLSGSRAAHPSPAKAQGRTPPRSGETGSFHAPPGAHRLGEKAAASGAQDRLQHMAGGHRDGRRPALRLGPIADQRMSSLPVFCRVAGPDGCGRGRSARHISLLPLFPLHGRGMRPKGRKASQHKKRKLHERWAPQAGRLTVAISCRRACPWRPSCPPLPQRAVSGGREPRAGRLHPPAARTCARQGACVAALLDKPDPIFTAAQRKGPTALRQATGAMGLIRGKRS